MAPMASYDGAPRSQRPWTRILIQHVRNLGGPGNLWKTGILSERQKKAKSRTICRYVVGDSDKPIGAKKRMNKGNQQERSCQKLAESVEQSGLAEGNVSRTPVADTQRSDKASRGLTGVREAAKRDKELRFTALLHHLDETRLTESYAALKRDAAPGVDGVTWRGYETGHQGRIRDLHDRIHKGRYRAQPVRCTRIPKEDGTERQLGVTALEDKIVQHGTASVLNAIYEQDFLGFSYGFRLGRSPHDALDALWVGLVETPVNYVLDVDIRGFFDHIQHEWLLRFLRHRIGDQRILRLIDKWLRVGVLDDGNWLKPKQGSPQGAVISPLLANIYLHYVYDLWAQQWRQRTAKGNVIMVRYADDIVLGFQHREEAERFLAELTERLDKFGLSLHPDKTRMVEFGCYAIENRKRQGVGKPETFDFLGFTHICAHTRKGAFTIRRKTIAKRLRRKLQQLKMELRKRMHDPVPELGKWLRSVVQGYYRYHGVPYNLPQLRAFRHHLSRAWLRMLRRRSQKARKQLTWEKFERIRDAWVPLPYVTHPWPDKRFRRHHPRQEPYAVTPHVRISTGGAS